VTNACGSVRRNPLVRPAKVDLGPATNQSGPVAPRDRSSVDRTRNEPIVFGLAISGEQQLVQAITMAGWPQRTTGIVRATDAHPAGTYTVTVTAFDTVGGSATKTFALTVTTPVTCNPVSFAAATNFAAGDAAFSVVVGDFDSDGHQDLATANQFSDNVSISLGDGAGHFSPPTNFTVGIDPTSVTVGDFNGDGKQDLAVANQASSYVSILLGDGTGHFTSTNVTVGSISHAVAVGDFNDDGKQDLATTNWFGTTVSILLGDGAGHFGAPTQSPAGLSPFAIAVGDFNRDGSQDLAVASYGSTNVSILLGDGAGNFSLDVYTLVGGSPTAVAVGDFNADGNQDLAVSNDNPAAVSILLGNGAGNFSAPVSFTVGDIPRSVAVGDFNADGKQDLATANFGSDSVSILLRDCPVVSTKVQGRGTVDNQGNEVTFNFSASQSDEGGTLGYFSFCDPAAGVCITKARIWTLSFAGNTADFSGRDDASRLRFRVSATDNGDPGTSDTISISLSTGYFVSSPLINGDIRIQ
jgi:FG-GAP-like repeat